MTSDNADPLRERKKVRGEGKVKRVKKMKKVKEIKKVKEEAHCYKHNVIQVFSYLFEYLVIDSGV